MHSGIWRELSIVSVRYKNSRKLPAVNYCTHLQDADNVAFRYSEFVQTAQIYTPANHSDQRSESPSAQEVGTPPQPIPTRPEQKRP
jgi:hypothetical protein